MTFLAPGFLIAAGAVSLGVVVLHFLITQQPKSELLPTVRFVPDVPARSTSLAIKPSDLLLLLVRVLAIMLIGAAFAQPQLTPQHQAVAKIVVVDASRAVGNMQELADSAKVHADGAAAVIVFDSVARELPLANAMDSLNALASRPASTRRGSLSPALITSLRAAARVREAADSIDLIVVSPFANEERDAATSRIRALWPGRIQTVQVGIASDTSLASGQSIRVQWADSGATQLWTKREQPDTVGAVRAGEAVMVYPFVRTWQPASQLDSNTHVYARWVDGEPAAFETNTESGCVRSVAITMPTAGDAILRPDFVRFQKLLTEPCGTAHDFAPMPSEFMSLLAGSGNLASVSDIKPVLTKMTPLVPWLLLTGLLLLLLELFMRYRTEIGAAKREQSLATTPNSAPKAKGAAA
jgi:hypothetical protein